MKHAIWAFVAAAFLAAPIGFAASAKKMVCTETGKEVKSCCCTVKDGTVRQTFEAVLEQIGIVADSNRSVPSVKRVETEVSISNFSVSAFQGF